MAGGTADEAGAVIAEGKAALEAGDLALAMEAFAAVLQAEPDRVEAMAGLARAYLLAGDAERARAILGQVPEDKRGHEDVAAIEAALALAEKAASAGELEPLRARVEADPATSRRATTTPSRWPAAAGTSRRSTSSSSW